MASSAKPFSERRLPPPPAARGRGRRTGWRVHRARCDLARDRRHAGGGGIVGDIWRWWQCPRIRKTGTRRRSSEPPWTERVTPALGLFNSVGASKGSMESNPRKGLRGRRKLLNGRDGVPASEPRYAAEGRGGAPRSEHRPPSPCSPPAMVRLLFHV